MDTIVLQIVHDMHRGPLVYVRVYSGVLSVRDVLYNCDLATKERASKVLRVHADDFEEVNEVWPMIVHWRSASLLVLVQPPAHGWHCFCLMFD